MVIKLRNSRYLTNINHVVINWGNSSIPQWFTEDTKILNHPNKVAVATNKLATLSKLKENGVPTVPFTDDQDIADLWVCDGNKVYARHKLDGHSGEGIEVIQPSNRTFAIQEAQRLLDSAGLEQIADILDLEYQSVLDEESVPTAPLYTLGVSNNGEYRVHVFKDEVILYQKKSRRLIDEDEVDVPTDEQSDIRNLESGWVYRTGNLERLERIEHLALDTIKALGLDFGAVDIIMDSEGAVFVLEVNTAPGLGNTQTKDAYINAFNSMS